MSYEHSFDAFEFAGIQELTFDEIDQVDGGRGKIIRKVFEWVGNVLTVKEVVDIASGIDGESIVRNVGDPMDTKLGR